MNKLFSLLFLGSVLTACGSAYKIEGNSSINEFDGRMVYLRTFSEEGALNVDSAEVIHGIFKMKGQVDSTTMVTLFLDDESVMPLVLEDGTIKITLAYDRLHAGGTPMNNSLYDFIDKRNELDIKIEELERKEARMILDGANVDDVQEEIQKEAERLLEEMNLHVKSFIRTNYETVLGPSVFIMLCSGLPYPVMTPQIEDILNDAPYSFKSNRLVREFVNKAKDNMQLIEEHRRMKETE